MGQLTVRKVDDDPVGRLKVRAVKHDRLAEAEVRAVLEEALRPKTEDFWTLADRLRAEAPPMPDSSTGLIRRMRDER